MAPPDKRKKIKTGGITLEEAKKKINDPNYNVMSGRIEKDKNVQTGKNKRRITKEDMLNIGMGAVPFARIPKFISKLGGLLKPSQRFQKLVANTKKSKTPALPKLRPVKPKSTPALPKPRPVKPKSTAVTKPKNTQIKTPSTAVANRPRMSSANAKRLQQMVNRAALTSGVSELVKPKKSVADTKPKAKKIKGVMTGPELDLPKKKTPKVAPKKAPVKKKRSNITQRGKPTSSYDAQFTYDNLVKRGGKKFAKGRMSPENYAKVKKKAGGGSMKKTMKMTSGGSLKPVPEGNQGKGLSKLPTPVRNKMGYMKKGGVVKMRGGGAATRGLNFNRGY